MARIISLSGKKQSGKSSACEWIKCSIIKKELNLKINLSQFPNGHMAIEYNGDVYPSLEKLAEKYEGNNLSYSSYIHLIENINRTCRIYSFADVLKEACITVFGLNKNQVYGTDDEKNTYTIYKWENIPHSIRPVDTNGNFRTGNLTARELLQYFGTDVCRKMFDEDIWVKSTLSKINSDNPKIALISDMRFKTELKAISEINDSLIIRLNRNTNFVDGHSSEKDLDNVDWENINNCLIINPTINDKTVDIPEKNRIIEEFLKQRGIL